MGFRDAFIANTGLGSIHNEAVLFALDQELRPDKPAEMLLVGVGNGGTLQILETILPEGSAVGGLDTDVRCQDLGLSVQTGDLTDRQWLHSLLVRSWFDYILDCTRGHGIWVTHLWPYLRPGGKFMIEDPHPDLINNLINAFPYGDGYLPGEEIIRLSVYPGMLVIEKRTPRVVPYLEIFTGSQFPVRSENELKDAGARRLVTENPE